VKLPTLVECPECKEKKVPHKACLLCGTYNGRKVLEVVFQVTMKIALDAMGGITPLM